MNLSKNPSVSFYFYLSIRQTNTSMLSQISCEGTCFPNKRAAQGRAARHGPLLLLFSVRSFSFFFSSPSHSFIDLYQPTHHHPFSKPHNDRQQQCSQFMSAVPQFIIQTDRGNPGDNKAPSDLSLTLAVIHNGGLISPCT